MNHYIKPVPTPRNDYSKAKFHAWCVKETAHYNRHPDRYSTPLNQLIAAKSWKVHHRKVDNRNKKITAFRRYIKHADVFTLRTIMKDVVINCSNADDISSLKWLKMRADKAISAIQIRKNEKS